MIHSIISKDGNPLEEADAVEALTFADKRGVERRTVAANSLLTATLSEFQYNGFGVMWQRYVPKADCEITIRSEVRPALLLSVADMGAFTQRVATYAVDNKNVTWQKGCANINRIGGVGCVTTPVKDGEAVGIFNVVVPDEALHTLLEHYPHLLEPLDRYIKRGEGSFFAHNRPLPNLAANAMRDLWRCRLLGEAAYAYIETKVTELLAAFLEVEATATPFGVTVRGKMHDARDIILANYREMPSLHALATMVGTNECTLKKAFKMEFGTTVFQFLFDHRMLLAVKYLLDTSLSVQSVAHRLGYDYQSHFCTAFKRKYGVSPSRFRSQRRFPNV